MKKLNMYLVLAGLISSLVIFSGCDQPNSTSDGGHENNKYIPVTSVTLSKSSISGTAGDSIDVTATVLPENATEETLFWQNVSDKVSVKVDQNDSTKASLLIRPEIINVHLNNEGRLVGLEPTTSCSTDKRSAIELQPPYYRQKLF